MIEDKLEYKPKLLQIRMHQKLLRINLTASIGFSPAIKINSPDTNNANVKFTKGTITLDTHHGTFDLSTTILLITQHQPSIIQVHGQ